MSVKVRIDRVTVTGARPYLGIGDDGSYWFSDDPEDVMRWLAGAWRFRYNAAHGNRDRYWCGEKTILEPRGERDVRSDSDFKADFDWMAAIPSKLLMHARQAEDRDWWAAIERNNTLAEKGMPRQPMPGFKKAKWGSRFGLYSNNGRCLTFVKYSKRHGEIIFGGINPKERREPGMGARWKVHIHVRLTGQRIPDFTSIWVNWTERELIFVAKPGKRDHKPTGKSAGLDMGVAHAFADSDGNLHDLPVETIARIAREIGDLERAKARIIREAKCKDEKDYVRTHGRSNRFRRIEERISALYKRRTRIIVDWQHKATSKLVDSYDLIAMEDLKIQNMTKAPKAKPDPDNPGHWLPNGRSAKAALNGRIYDASWGRFRNMLEYKSEAAGIDFVLVDPAFTSQRCHRCGHTCKENRESQAVFHCVRCGFTGNADVNAALNILHDGLEAKNESVRAGHVRCADTGRRTPPDRKARRGGLSEAQSRPIGETPRDAGIPRL